MNEAFRKAIRRGRQLNTKLSIEDILNVGLFEHDLMQIGSSQQLCFWSGTCLLRFSIVKTTLRN